MGKYTNAAILNIFLLLFNSHVAITEERYVIISLFGNRHAK